MLLSPVSKNDYFKYSSYYIRVTKYRPWVFSSLSDKCKFTDFYKIFIKIPINKDPYYSKREILAIYNGSDGINGFANGHLDLLIYLF